MNERKVPEIRFKEYKDDWEQRKVSDVVGTTYGGGTPSTSNEEYWEGEIPWIQSSNVIEDELFDVDVKKHISKQGLNHSAAQLVPKNSVAVVTHVGVGKIVFMPFPYTTSQDFISLADLKCSPRFLSYALYKKLQEDLHIVQGSAIKGITKDDLMSKQIVIPKFAEQEKIADTLQGLDNLITLHQRKHKKLIEVKKSMLKKMFPQNGAKVPEIRFEGFTDDWKQRKFSELYALVNEKNDLTYGIDKNITVATMQFKGDIKVATEEYLRTYNVCKKGDIAFEGHKSKEFQFGRFIENDIGEGIVSHIFAVFRPIGDYDLYFWKYAINNERLMAPILSRCTKASTMMNDLVISDFLNESFLVPSIDEQRKIGTILHRVDNLITLHQRKLDKLLNIRKSLLEKMFP